MNNVFCAYELTDLTDSVAKGICKILLLTINRYHDPKSRRRVREFVSFFMKKCDAEGIKFRDIFATVLHDYCKLLERISVT